MGKVICMKQLVCGEGGVGVGTIVSVFGWG